MFKHAEKGRKKVTWRGVVDGTIQSARRLSFTGPEDKASAKNLSSGRARRRGREEIRGGGKCSEGAVFEAKLDLNSN